MKYWFKNVADNIYIYPKSAPRNLILQTRTSDCNSASGFKKVKTVKVSKKKSYSFQITKNGKKKFKKGTYYVQVTPKVKFGNKTYSSDVSTVASAYVYK